MDLFGFDRSTELFAGSGLSSGILWVERLGELGEAAPVDPYLVWFDWTTDGPLGDEGGQVELLVEVRPDSGSVGDTAADVLKRIGFDFHGSDRPQHGSAATFFTGRLALGKLGELIKETKALQPRVLRFELASPRFIAGGVGSSSPDFAAALSQAPGQDEAAGLRSREPSHRSTDGASSVAVVVIDDFCNFAARDTREAIQSLWHQGRTRAARTRARAARYAVGLNAAAPDETDDYWVLADDGSHLPAPRPSPPAPQPAPGPATCPAPQTPAQPPPRPRYGAALRLDRLCQIEEAEVYATIRMAPVRRPPLQWSHGSAVLSALLGHRRNLPGAAPDGLYDRPPPKAVHFVQLPEATVLDTSGGSLAVFALDAIHHAAKAAAHTELRHVIVNLSYGTHSGAHDGTSMFERAMLEMLDRYDGQHKIDGVAVPTLHIVLPAGNGHLSQTHASRCLPPRGSTVLQWRILPDDDTDSFMEVWAPRPAKLQIQLFPPDDGPGLSVRSGGDSNRLVESFIDARGKPSAVLRAAIIFPGRNARSLSSDGALIAVAPTLRRSGFGRGERHTSSLSDDPGVGDRPLRVPMEAPPGTWIVRVTNLTDQPTELHAWIQRDDAAPGRHRGAKGYLGRQSYFVDTAPRPGSHCSERSSATTTSEPTPPDPRYTANGIATAVHRRLWVVGAMDERGVLARYSAAGPSRSGGERLSAADAVTVVDRSEALPGRHVGGVFSGARLRLSGTSIAAAVFTRLLHGALAAGATAMHWCNSLPPARPRPCVAGEPEMADDLLRGALVRLAHADDIATPPNAPCAAVTGAAPKRPRCGR